MRMNITNAESFAVACAAAVAISAGSLVVGWLIYEMTESAFLLGAVNGFRALPLLFLAPLPLVPVLVATGFLLGRLRTRVGRNERGHALSDLAGTWFALGPVWALAVLAPGEQPAIEYVWIYGVAFAAQVLVGAATRAGGEVVDLP